MTSYSRRRLTLTWLSVMPRAYARRALSGPAKYLVCSNVFSNANIWWPEKVGRVCFFFESRSNGDCAPVTKGINWYMVYSCVTRRVHSHLSQNNKFSQIFFFIICTHYKIRRNGVRVRRWESWERKRRTIG